MSLLQEDSKEAMQAKELDLLFKQSKQQLTRQAAEAICLAASNKQQSSELVAMLLC